MPRRILSSRSPPARLLPTGLLLVLTLGGLTLGACAMSTPRPRLRLALHGAGRREAPSWPMAGPDSDEVLMMMACASGSPARDPDGDRT